MRAVLYLAPKGNYLFLFVRLVMAVSCLVIILCYAQQSAAATQDPCNTLSSVYPNAPDDCVSGYTSVSSVNKGGSLVFKISVNPAPQNYTIAIYRMGWYNGAGSTLVSSVPEQAGIKQPDCPMDEQTGLTECNWVDSYTLDIPDTWTTGVYTAIVTNDSGWQTSIVFVVRDDNRAADFLYQLPILTYAAYNNYPAGSPTGKSTYDSDSRGVNTLVGTTRAVKVSLDRPLHSQFGGWLGSSWSEIHLVAWLEKMGYSVNYTTDLDVHMAKPGYLESYKGIIIGGHSEYWTKAMYDKIERARDAGSHLAFFGANAVHWQVRMENSSQGVPNRILTCYKDVPNVREFDPITDPQFKTMKWRDLGRAEQTLIGVQHDINGWNLDTAHQPPFIVQNSAHWAYKNSKLQDNDLIPYLIGYEVDNLDEAYPLPPLLTPSSQTFLGTSPYINHSGSPYISQASIYQAPSGSWVFGSGTMSWTYALTRQPRTFLDGTPTLVYQNAGIYKITRNILDTYAKTVIEPLETKVLTVYQDDNYTGTSQQFGFGKYLASHKELAVVGDKTISSFKIKPGYTVLMCNNPPPLDRICKTYKTNTNEDQLAQDDLDDQISYIEVKPRTNMALGKKAKQSSTYRGVAVAGRAVDGDTDGNYADKSVALTNAEQNAWWQVDLGKPNPIRNVMLGKQASCCYQLGGFYVFISATDLTGRSFDDIVEDDDVWRYYVEKPMGSSLSIATPSPVTGRYVRVQLANKGAIGLREVLIR